MDVPFPASVKANVKLKSDRGNIYSDFDIDVDKSQPKINRSTQLGMYRVTVDDWVYGKINNGDPEVMMKGMQGSIYVRKGNKDLLNRWVTQSGQPVQRWQATKAEGLRLYKNFLPNPR